MNEKRKFTITNFELGSQNEVEAYFIKKISKNDLKYEMNIFKIYDQTSKRTYLCCKKTPK